MNKEEAYEYLKSMKKERFEIQCEVLEGGKLPTKANKTDAGFDLYATSDVVIYPGQVQKHPLNIKLKLPRETWANITSKSGLGSKGLLVYAGVVDEEYRGVPHVVMSNINLIERVDEEGFPVMRITPIVVKKGQKLAQLVMCPHSSEYYITQVDRIDTNTERGEGGFGSTGV